MKIAEKVSYIKNTKNGPIWRVFENQLVSVLNRTKIGGNAKIEKLKCDILVDFQTLCSSGHTVQNLHFFVQKFNFDFPRKLSIFFGEKLVKMFWTFYLLTTLISREKLSKKLDEKLVKMLGFCKN